MFMCHPYFLTQLFSYTHILTLTHTHTHNNIILTQKVKLLDNYLFVDSMLTIATKVYFDKKKQNVLGIE